MTPEDFRRETGVSRETLGRLELYAGLLAQWNRRINLVSRASLEDLWRRHMLDSAQLMDHLPPLPADGRRVLLDLGSGAGFPGLVLALLGAGEVHLVEADARKATFLREANRRTRAGARVHNGRIESLVAFPVDVVTARACAPLPRLLGYAARFPARGAGCCCLFLKGKRVQEELTEARKEWTITADSFLSRSDSSGTILRIGLIERDSTTT